MCRAIAVVTMNDKGVFYNLSHDFWPLLDR
jgi:hypothetical protein